MATTRRTPRATRPAKSPAGRRPHRATPRKQCESSVPASQGQRAIRGRRLTGNQLYYLLTQVLAAAGLAGAVNRGALVHAFRHTYGTLLAATGQSMPAIRDLMGHASLTTTQGYIEASGRHTRAAAAANPTWAALDEILDD